MLRFVSVWSPSSFSLPPSHSPSPSYLHVPFLLRSSPSPFALKLISIFVRFIFSDLLDLRVSSNSMFLFFRNLGHGKHSSSLVCKSMARCIVNRLPCGAELQKLCASAVASFDSMFCPDYMEKKYPYATCRIQFEESTPTSVIIVLDYEDHLLKKNIGCRLWHRKSVVKDYPEQPTFIVFRPEKRFKISHLHLSTEYSCKISLFSSTGVLGVLEAKWETPASDRSCFTALKHGKAEHTIIAQDHLQVESTKFGNIKLAPPAKLQPLVDINKSKSESFCSLSLFIETISPSTPCRCSGMRAFPDIGCKKRLEEIIDYEHSVPVVKWLEHEGHLDEDFRVKFLTWFSLKATEQERRVVNVFVATFF